MSSLRFFLYRRLCRWISCELRLPFQARLSLASKYDVASFQDVFCHPFYWQVFAWLSEPPRLVVDCGANCGHFTALVDTCVRVKFGRSDTRYLLVEPNPALRPILERNLRDAGMAGRYRVLTALLGSKSGSGTLWVHPKNYLASSLAPLEGARPYTVPFIDLAAHLPETVDLLKMDIEGGEYTFTRENPDVLERVRLLLMEIHDAPPQEREVMFERLERAGLQPSAPALQADGLCLQAWSRSGVAAEPSFPQSLHAHATACP